MKSRFVIAAVAVALASAAALASAQTGLLRGDPGSGHLGAGLANPVRVSGHVGGLYPGARRTLRATVRNRSSRPVVVHSLRVEIGRSGAGCARKNLIIFSSDRVQRVIRARGRGRVGLPARMRADAPNSCQGARFPLRFRAGVSSPGSVGG